MLTLFPRIKPNPPQAEPPAPPETGVPPEIPQARSTPEPAPLVEQPQQLEPANTSPAAEIPVPDPSPQGQPADKYETDERDWSSTRWFTDESARTPLAAANVFDEMDIVHEAGLEELPGQSVLARIPLVVPEAVPQPADEGAAEQAAGAEAIIDAIPAQQESVERAERAAPPEVELTAQELPVEPLFPIDAQSDIADAPPSDLTQAAGSNNAPAVPLPTEVKRQKGSFFVLPRVPEPEVMDDSAEVAAYSSAAAQSYLDALDDTFVAHAQLLLKGRERGRALDIGTGPGQIVMKLGYRLTRWKFVGVDRSPAMIEKARESLQTAPELAGRVEFLVADGNQLDFADAAFDLVVCNSVLHHLAEPQKVLAEIARLAKPNGAILLRDLRRPSRLAFGGHIRRHGKHYAGDMKRLYVASVRAAYTEDELQALLDASSLRGLSIFRHGKTHIGFARPSS